jgi:hypothetical protein
VDSLFGQSYETNNNFGAMKIECFAAVSWLASCTAAGPPKKDARLHPLQPSRRDSISAHTIPMRKHNLAPSTTHPALQRRVNFPAKLKNIYDVYYSIDLTVGNQTIPVSVDTGSSDTWMVQEPYECVSFWFDPDNVRPPMRGQFCINLLSC